MGYSLVCPDCRGKFRWDPIEGMPDDCPLCQSHIGHDREDDDIVMPSIRSMRTTATDKVYQDIVDGSEKRAALAAETAGVPVSEMSELKITNLNTRRDAEIMAMPVVNDVTRHMDQINQKGGKFGFGDGAGYAAGAATGAVTVNGQTVQGIEPRAGTRANQRIQRAFGKF